MATYIRRREFLSTLCGIAVAWPSAARAQTYPSRPITMVVPFAAGGSFDVIGRILAARMSEILGQQVIVENTSGAAGIIGVNRVVNASPDGYTLLFGSIGTHAYNQNLSMRRARVVQAELIKDGVPQNVIAIQGFGDTHLLVATGPGVREPQNRRVEIILR